MLLALSPMNKQFVDTQRDGVENDVRTTQRLWVLCPRYVTLNNATLDAERRILILLFSRL